MPSQVTAGNQEEGANGGSREPRPPGESVTLLKLALRAARAGSWAWDMVTGEIVWSEEYHHLIGASPGAVQPSYDAWMDTVHPEDRGRVVEEFQEALAQRREIELEYRVLRGDGATRWMSARGEVLYDEEGTTPLRVVGVSFDVTERRAATEALRRREEELRVITDGVPSMISYVDAQQRYQYNNRRYDDAFGLSPGELAGRGVREVLGEAAYEEVRPHIESALAGEETRFVRWMDYRLAGPRCVEGRYIPHRDDQGEVRGFFALIHDITDHKTAEAALRESEERFRAAVENMLDCLGLYTAVRGADGKIVDFRIEYVNAAACANNLMTREEQVGRLLCELLPGHRDSELFHDYCRVIETGEPLIKETLHYEDDYPGQRLARSFDIRAARLGDGFIAVWRDVTGRKLAENRLRESETLLRDADRRKDEFLAMLAHELRNPLASIRNALEVQRRLGTADTRLGQMRDVIERQTEQLTRLVDDLLDVSRISQGKITLRKATVDLLSVIARAVETSRPVIDGGGHRLTVSVPPGPVELEGDPARLAQAVSNLLNNAAKYTERGGNIWLTAKVENGEAEVRVKDDGIGIPAEALPRVFDLFAQAERSLDRAQGGLGIGLTLVKNIVDLHGGSAEIFSPGPGQGCEVVLRLPRGTVAPASADGSAGPASLEKDPRSRCRVLVVDDNLDAAESLAMLLELTGQEVRTAHDGRAAVDLAVAFEPHLVLLDIGLPGMNGYEVAHHLRERLEKGAVLVAVTGYGQPEDRRKARAAGFDHHLTKPVDYGALQSLIANLTVC